MCNKKKFPAVTINNTELPVKVYQGQRVVTMREIDMVHERPEGTARKRFNDNKEHFIEGVDYFVRNSDEAMREFGITAPNGLTIVTQSGYLMLVKSFTDDLAWTVQRQLVNTYFQSTPEQRQKAAQQTKMQPPKRPPLSSINGAMKLSLPALEKAGVSPEFIALTVAETYRPYGIMIPQDCITVKERFMDQTEIAKTLGILVASSGNPSARAIGGIINEIGVANSEIKKAPFTKNGHSDAGDLYAESIIPRIVGWLEEHGYPLIIKGRDGKNQHVKYVGTETKISATTAACCGA